MMFNIKYNKSTAIEEVLKISGFTWNNCMSFGDADNDIDMIQKLESVLRWPMAQTI